MNHQITAWLDKPQRPWWITRCKPPSGREARLNFEHSYHLYQDATDEEYDFALEAGESYHRPLLRHLERAGHKVSSKMLSELILMDEWADIQLLEEKSRWQVLRPYEQARYYGIEVKTSPESLYAFGSSYPSGHTILARLWALALAEHFPEQSIYLIKLSEKIALSRVHAFVHTIADIEYGLALGDEAWSNRFK